MQAILIPLLAAVIHGETIGAVLSGVTTSQWLSLAAGVGEEIEPSVAKMLGLKAPSFSSLGELVDGLVKTFGDDVAKAAISDWFSANADKAIELQPGAIA